jgi:uncharacterized protein
MTGRLAEMVLVFGGLLLSLAVLFVPITIGLVLLQRWLGDDRLARLLGGERLAPALAKGTLLGAVTPFCGCSTVPLLLGLLRARVRFAGVAAFMLASPLLNPYILGVVALLFGGRTAVVYAAFAVVTSVGLGALWEAAGLECYLKAHVRAERCEPANADRRPAPIAAGVAGSVMPPNRAEGATLPACTAGDREACGPGGEDGGGADRLGAAPQRWHGIRRELVDAWSGSLVLLRPMLRPLLLGVAIGAAIYGVVPEGWLAGVLGAGSWWAVPLAALLGIPFYLRGEAAFPIGASLLSAGVGVAPMFAMVIAGMGASVPEVTILSGIFERRLLAAFLLSVFVTAIAGGLVLHWMG